MRHASGWIIWLIPAALYALPLYTAREGRLCDNCHASPFPDTKQSGWKDPELRLRKCNLSCQSCHYDVTGGGMRRAPGRYLSSSTLPVFGNDLRPWHDRKRSVSALLKAAFAPAPKPAPKSNPGPPPPPPQIATSPERYQASPVPANYTFADPFVLGRPVGDAFRRSPTSPLYGVYGPINAAPLLAIGGDIRFATIRDDRSGETASFPMQTEVGAAVHPVEHFTVGGSAGVLGVRREDVQIPVEERIYLRSAYAMIHDLPYMAYLRGGVLLPSFGTRIEDHTAYTRQYFEMDTSKRFNTVYGAEVGIAPNYPYLNLSVFTNRADTNVPNGWGTALSAGWRDLAWGAGFSLMHKARTAEFGGNLTAFSLDGYWNPGRWWLYYPLTLSGEVAWGYRSGTPADNRLFYAQYLMVDYLIANGINIKLQTHFYDPDTSIRGDEIGRFSAGPEITLVNGVRVLLERRWNWSQVPDSTFRQSPFVNPYDFVYNNQWVLITHLYF